MYKDQVYLKGAVEILINRNNIDFTNLYAGKISLKDYHKLEERGQIERDKITLPYFLEGTTSMKNYKKALDKIARVNYIETYAHNNV